MIRKLWLRDYDLVAMKKRIKVQLANGEDPDDCVVKISDLREAIKKIPELKDTGNISIVLLQLGIKED